jgi:hypothetical protein
MISPCVTAGIQHFSAGISIEAPELPFIMAL